MLNGCVPGGTKGDVAPGAAPGSSLPADPPPEYAPPPLAAQPLVRLLSPLDQALGISIVEVLIRGRAKGARAETSVPAGLAFTAPLGEKLAGRPGVVPPDPPGRPVASCRSGSVTPGSTCREGSERTTEPASGSNRATRLTFSCGPPTGPQGTHTL